MVISSALIGLPYKKIFFHFMPFCNLDHLFYWSPTLFDAPLKISGEHIVAALSFP